MCSPVPEVAIWANRLAFKLYVLWFAIEPTKLLPALDKKLSIPPLDSTELEGLSILGLERCNPTCLTVKANPCGVIRKLVILSKSSPSLRRCGTAPPLIKLLGTPEFKSPGKSSILGLFLRASTIGFLIKGSELNWLYCLS